jgi:hypothetical protein
LWIQENDVRRLDHHALEALRERAVRKVQEGESQLRHWRFSRTEQQAVTRSRQSSASLLVTWNRALHF